MPVKTKRLFLAEAHEVHHVTDSGDNSEPSRLVDTSIVEIQQDTGKILSLLALELDEIARKWLSLRLRRSRLKHSTRRKP